MSGEGAPPHTDRAAAPLPVVSERAVHLGERLVRGLREAAREAAPAAELVSLLDRELGAYVDESLRANPDRRVHCERGCGTCCVQWVDDVAAFEIETIGRWVLASGRGVAIRDALAARVRAFAAVARRHRRRSGEHALEHAERLALAYMELGLRCVFLGADGACGIYPVRPLRCRTYFSLAPPAGCTAEALAAGRSETFTLAPPGAEEAVEEADAAWREASREPPERRARAGALVTSLHRWLVDRLPVSAEG
jgi:Fe-S-cluster containining protein